MAATEAHGIRYEFVYAGGPFTLLRIGLPQGGAVKAQSGAMMTMDATLDVESRMEGGLLGGLARKFLTGENFFFQTLRAVRGPGEVSLVPGILGDLAVLELDGQTEYIVQKGGFFAATEGVEISTKMQSLGKGLFSGEGFLVQRLTGRGLLFVESFGAVHPIDIPPGAEKIIDNHHLVAWPATMPYTLEKSSAGWLSSLTSGEGVVCRFQGPGRVYTQTRNPPGFASWISGMIPRK